MTRRRVDLKVSVGERGIGSVGVKTACSPPGRASSRESRFFLGARTAGGGVPQPRGRYFVKTFGCQMNLHDSEVLRGILEEAGFQEAGTEEEADLVVFNTCCVRDNADKRLYGNVARLQAQKAKNPDFRIAVGGCLAQKDRESLLRKAGEVDVVFGTHNLHRLVDLLDIRDQEGSPVCEVWDEPRADVEEVFALPRRRESRFSAWVTISVGCDNTCTFCIVPRVRGPERSRRPADVVAEVRQLVEEGVVEVTLLGQNVNSYGRDLGLGGRKPLFAELLKMLEEIEGLRRVRFTSPHPKDLRPETIEAMATCTKVMPHLHLPLQSGSDRILKAMHRGYTAERYLERLERARSAIEDLAVTTDIIVGFPGETEEDFKATLDVCREAKFDGAYMFLFSPRPGTPAASMPYDINPSELHDRFDRLVALIEECSMRAHHARIGKVEEVLVEGRDPKEPSRLRGRTPQNKVVLFSVSEALGAADEPRAGEFVDVRIVAAGPHHLEGIYDPERRFGPETVAA